MSELSVPKRLEDCCPAYSTYSAALEFFFPEPLMVAGSLGRRVVTESSASSATRGVVYIRWVI